MRAKPQSKRAEQLELAKQYNELLYYKKMALREMANGKDSIYQFMSYRYTVKLNKSLIDEIDKKLNAIKRKRAELSK